MTLVPHRTAVAQVAAQITAEIAAGRWPDWLPGERELERHLQVSRSTLRIALEQLQRAGITQARHGVGHQVLAPRRPSQPLAPRSLAVLAPEPLARLRPTQALWIDELKDQLHATGCELRFIQGRSYYQPRPGRALQRLLRQEKHAGWVLVLSTEAMQTWFVEQGIPCVIAGSPHHGIVLPSVDLNYRAIGHHAAGVLLRAGHRRIVLVNRRLRGAGEIETETGFLEAAQQSSYPHVDATVVHYDETLESVVTVTRRLASQARGPTGWLVTNSHYYLAATTELTRRGRRIPDDLSVISRDDDPFLNFVLPRPARYLNDSQLFARKLLPLALGLVEQRAVRYEPVRIVPRFEPGGSVGAPAS